MYCPLKWNHQPQRGGWRQTFGLPGKSNAGHENPRSRGSFGIKKWECEVISNYNVASFIKEFVVKLPEGESLEFQSGGYIQIDVPGNHRGFQNMDITAHPKYHDDPKSFSQRDKFKLWDLKMVNEEPQFRAYSMAKSTLQKATSLNWTFIATSFWQQQNVDECQSGCLLIIHLQP